jgi:hypothetical protein
VVLVFGLGQAAKAESLAEKKKWKEEAESIESGSLKPLNEKCGTKVTFEFSKDSFKNWPEDRSVSGYCKAVLDTMWGMCDDEDSKKEIVSKVQKVVCKNVGKGKNWQLSFSGKTLNYGVDQDGVNADQFNKEWLMKNL